MKKSLWLGWCICGLGALFYCYEYLLRITPSLISTELREAFQLDATTFGGFAALYYLASAPMQLAGGVLMDTYGPRRLLILASIICAAGIYLFTQYSFPILAGVGRFMGGIGGAFAFVGALKLATIWLPPRLFGIVSGLITSLGMLGAIMGDVFVVFLMKSWGWQQTLVFLSLVGLVISSMMLFGLPDKRYGDDHEAPADHGFQDLLAGLSVLIKNRYIWINGFIGGMLYLSLAVFAELWGPLYLRSAYLYTPAEASRGMAMVFLGWAVGSPLFGWLSEHINRRRLPLFISNLVIALTISLVFYLPASTPKSLVLILLFLFGLFSAAQVVSFMVAKELVSTPRLVGTSIAFTNTISIAFGAILQPFVGKMLDWQWQGAVINQLRVYSPHEYHMALLLIPLGTLMAAGLVYFLKETATGK